MFTTYFLKYLFLVLPIDFPLWQIRFNSLSLPLPLYVWLFPAPRLMTFCHFRLYNWNSTSCSIKYGENVSLAYNRGLRHLLCFHLPIIPPFYLLNSLLFFTFILPSLIALAFYSIIIIKYSDLFLMNSKAWKITETHYIMNSVHY